MFNRPLRKCAGFLFAVVTVLSLALPSFQAGAQTPGLVSFAAIGDFGENNNNHTRVADLIKSWNPDLIITAGDNRYGNNNYDNVIGRRYCDFLQGVRSGNNCAGGNALENRFFPSIGNHEYSDGGGINEYLRYFSLPGNERYYDFVRGPVHFFAINSDGREPDGNSRNSIQARNLRDALAESEASWKVVFFHHAPYSSSSNHGSNRTLQWPFAAWGADVVISGHDHIYERIERDGIVYFVNGLGGRSFYGLGSPVAGSQVRYNRAFGAMLFTATPTTMDIMFESLSGFTDTKTLTKDPVPGAPTGLQAIGGDATVALDWADNPELDVVSYRVHRAEIGGGPHSFIASVDVSAYLDDTVVNGTPYFYVVTAVDADGNESDASAEVSATPGVPQAVTIAADGFESNTFNGGSGWLASWRRAGRPRIFNANPAAGARYARLQAATGLLKRPVDLTGVRDVRLVFWSRVKSFEGAERALVQVSTDGVTYDTVQTFTVADSDDTWRRYDLDLSAYDDTARLRIQFDAEMGSAADRWFVDGIEVRGVR